MTRPYKQRSNLDLALENVPTRAILQVAAAMQRRPDLVPKLLRAVFSATPRDEWDDDNPFRRL
jgi:hypothetical protein